MVKKGHLSALLLLKKRNSQDWTVVSRANILFEGSFRGATCSAKNKARLAEKNGANTKNSMAIF